MVITGCTTVPLNGPQAHITRIDYPEKGKTVTAYVGDYLVKKGKIVKEKVLVVRKGINGFNYQIPARTYTQIGYDSKNSYYKASGVTGNAFADPVRALALGKHKGAQLCVVTPFNAWNCYAGLYERKTRVSREKNSFQQTLIYSGRVGDKINISYREFNNDIARPAFYNNVEYELSSSSTIGYKGALLEITDADNSSITYKLIRNFN